MYYHHHIYDIRKTSTTKHRPPPSFAKQTGSAPSGIHRFPATLTKSSLHLLGGYRHCVYRSVVVTQEPFSRFGHYFYERCARPTATWVCRFFELYWWRSFCCGSPNFWCDLATSQYHKSLLATHTCQRLFWLETLRYIGRLTFSFVRSEVSEHEKLCNY